MSTKSYIGKLNADGTVTAIYCHYDGYIKNGVGEHLSTFYTEEAVVDKLLSLGNLSSLGRKPLAVAGTSQLYDSDIFCVSYKAAGKANEDAKIYTSLTDFMNSCTKDFTYLYKDGRWLYRCWSAPCFSPVDI